MPDIKQNSTPKDDGRIFLRGGDIVLHQRKQYKNCVWQMRVRLPDGSFERRSTHRSSEIEAREVAENRYQEMRAAVRLGISVTGVKMDKVCDDYCVAERHKASLKRSGKAIGCNRRTALVERYIKPYFAGKMIQDIKLKQIDAYNLWYCESWQHEMQTVRRVSSNTGRAYDQPLAVTLPHRSPVRPGNGAIQFANNVLNGIFELAVRNGHITRSEQPVLDSVKLDHKRRGTFTPEQEVTLFGHLGESDDNFLLLQYCKFLRLTGCRPGIETKLKFQDFSNIGGNAPHVRVHVRDGKTGPRIAIASNALQSVIAAVRNQHPNPQPDAWIWTAPNGRVVNKFVPQFAAVLKHLNMETDAGGNDLCLYSFRHAFISECIENCVDLKFLAKNCGTSVAMIERHYDHVLHHTQVSEIAKLIGKAG